MISLKPNFDCATVIVKHLCATYPGRCIFAAEVKDNGNLRDTHKSVTSAPRSKLIHIDVLSACIWADCLADFNAQIWTEELFSKPEKNMQ